MRHSKGVSIWMLNPFAAHRIGDRVFGAEDVKYITTDITDEDGAVVGHCKEALIPPHYCGKLVIEDRTMECRGSGLCCDGITELWIPDSLLEKTLYTYYVETIRLSDESREVDLGSVRRDELKWLKKFNWPKKATVLKSICGLMEEIIVPGQITRIEKYCFVSMPELRTVKLPKGIEKIEEGCFRDLPALQSITLPSSLRHIDQYCFCDLPALESIMLPEGLESIGAHSFVNNTALKRIVIPASVKTIGYCAFEGCTALESIVFEGDTKIAVRAFHDTPGYHLPQTPGLTTRTINANGLPVVDIHFDNRYLDCHRDELDEAFISRCGGHYQEYFEVKGFPAILLYSQSADLLDHPFKKIPFMGIGESVRDIYYEGDLSDDWNGINHSRAMWCTLSEREFEYDENTCMNTFNGLTLCLNPERVHDSVIYIGNRVYTGPEAIFDITVKDSGRGDEYHTRYHIFKNKTSSEWVAELLSTE